MHSLHFDRHNLLASSSYTPTYAIKNNFCQDLHLLLHTAKRGCELVNLEGDIDAKAGRLTLDVMQSGDPFGLNSCLPINGKRLFALCSEHRLVPVRTNFKCSIRWYSTWSSLSSSQRRTHIDHISINYRGCGSLQDCWSCWSTPLDSDLALVYTRLFMRFDEC